MLLLSFVLLAVAYQETEAEIEQRYVEEAKAAQKAFIEKGAITSGISLQYRDAFHRRDDPAMRPSLGSLRFFPEATLQGSDLKLLDRFQYVNSLEFYRRRFADNDFEVLQSLPGNGWPEKVSAENRQFSGLTPGTAYLVLHSETLTDAVLEHVAALKHLQTLDVEGQYSVDALTALAELKELKKLTIRSVSPRNLNTTEYGRYDANLQRSWKQPVKFPLSVTSLRLIDLAVTDDDLAGLSSVTGLGGLRLEGSLIHGPGLAHLKGLPVSSLFLVRCRLRDDALDHLKGLPIFSLGLIQCGLHDDDLAHLPAFPLLSEQYSVLSLGHNHFTDAAIEKLPDNVWNIQLGNNPITGGTAADWQRFKNLVGLNLESTLVDDTIYSRVAGIPNLTYLDLRRTRVTGKGIKVLTGTKVDGLILDYCPVTPDGLTEICQLQQLTGLDLNGIRLTTEQLQMIGSSLPKLTYLSIVGCGLTDDEIAALRGDSLSHVRSLNTKFEPMQPIKVGYVTPPAGGKLGNFPGLLESENARKAQKGDDDQ